MRKRAALRRKCRPETWLRRGSSNQALTATVDDAVITNGGVLIQVMDNDDATNGGMMSTDDPQNTNGGYAFDNTKDAAAFAAQYQNTSFTINEYWSIGQVANLVNSNGANAINITLADDAVWNVTGTSLVSSLTLSGNAQVVVPSGVTLTVGDTVYTDCVLTAD